MTRVLLLVIALLAIANAADQTATVEIQRLRGVHEQSLGKLRADLSKQVGPVRATYRGRLMDLLKQLANQGDDNASQAVLAEITRIEGGIEPSPEQRRKMTGLLLASRVLYEKSCGPTLAAATKAEAEVKAAWLRGLAELETKYGRSLDFNKIAAVKAERERLAQLDAAPVPVVAAVPPPPAQAPPPEAKPAALVLTPVDNTFVDQLTALAGGLQGSPIRLQGQDVLTTQRTFKPPVDISIEALTDSTNLRIGYAADQVIFNWEMNKKQLRVDGGPANGKHKNKAGSIPTISS